MSGTLVGVAIETAIGLGAAYALLALSFTVIFAATGYLNFALGDVVMLGTVVAYWAAARAHLPVALGIVAAIAVGSAVGFTSDQISVRPTWSRVKNAHSVVLLATMGLAFVITSVTAIVFGPDTYLVPSYVSPNPFFIAGVPVQPIWLVIVIVLVVLATIAQLVIRYTHIGQVLRATEENHELASVYGINVKNVVTVVFTLAGALAAFAGYLIAPETSASAYSGLGLLIDGSAAMVIGGFGSFSGAVIGGMIVGAVSGLGPLWLPPTAIDPTILGVMVVILLIRPEGLGGRRGQIRRV